VADYVIIEDNGARGVRYFDSRKPLKRCRRGSDGDVIDRRNAEKLAQFQRALCWLVDRHDVKFVAQLLGRGKGTVEKWLAGGKPQYDNDRDALIAHYLAEYQPVDLGVERSEPTRNARPAPDEQDGKHHAASRRQKRHKAETPAS
jgi:hypothetical protein